MLGFNYTSFFPCGRHADEKGSVDENAPQTERVVNPLLFGKSTPFHGGKKRSNMKHMREKKGKKTPAIGSATMEESVIERLLLKRERQEQNRGQCIRILVVRYMIHYWPLTF